MNKEHIEASAESYQGKDTVIPDATTGPGTESKSVSEPPDSSRQDREADQTTDFENADARMPDSPIQPSDSHSVPVATIDNTQPRDDIKSDIAIDSPPPLSTPSAEPEPSPLESIRDFDVKLTAFIDAQAAFSREAIAALKDELSLYRQNYVFERERAILGDLISIFDAVARIRSFYVATSESVSGEEGRMFSHMDGLAVQVEELLRRRDVERIETSERLQLEQQRAVETKDTDIPEDDRKIVRVRKPGFIRLGKVLRKEEVVILRYRAPISEGAVNGS